MARGQWYRLISYVLAASAAIWLSLGYALVSYQAPDSPVVRVFTGPAALVLVGNRFEIKPAISMNRIELRFSRQLAPHSAQTPLFSVDVDEGGYWLSIEGSADSPNLRGVNLSHEVELLQHGGYLGQHRIYVVRVNDQEVSLPDFLTHQLSAAPRLTLDYDFALNNLSPMLAEHVGARLLALIQVVLLVALFSQVTLLFFYWLQPPEITRHFEHPEEHRATLVDRFAGQFAIPLGLLGTLISIWVALEDSRSDYSSFGHILSVIRVAIFTSVLGLGTRVICGIREWQAKLFGRKP